MQLISKHTARQLTASELALKIKTEVSRLRKENGREYITVIAFDAGHIIAHRRNVEREKKGIRFCIWMDFPQSLVGLAPKGFCLERMEQRIMTCRVAMKTFEFSE